MKNGDTVLVRWKTRGAVIEDGRAYPRKPGEEDEMSFGRARSLEVAGMVEIVNPITTVPVISCVIEEEEEEESEE